MKGARTKGRRGQRREERRDSDRKREGGGFTVRETNVRGEGRWQSGGMAMGEEKDRRCRERERW